MPLLHPGEPEGQAGMTTTSYVTYRTLRDHVSSFAGVAAWQRGPASVTIDSEQVHADTLFVSGNYFEVLGTRPRVGRGLTERDETARTPSAVLSDGFWREAFRSDPSVLGRTVVANGIEYTDCGRDAASGSAVIRLPPSTSGCRSRPR